MDKGKVIVSEVLHKNLSYFIPRHFLDTSVSVFISWDVKENLVKDSV